MQDKIFWHGLVSGRVQGVGFRQYLQKQAIKLGIIGWARNLPDGRVEFFSCGDTIAMALFKSKLEQGPPGAQVENILTAEEAEHFFIIR